MTEKILLVSAPSKEIQQNEIEKEYWKWHYALKTKLTYPNLDENDLLKLGNIENQNIGLLALATYLKENNIEGIYLAPTGDMVVNREKLFLEKVLETIRKEKPSYVGLSAHTCGIPTAIMYSGAIKNLDPGIKTIIGGPHANGCIDNTTLTEMMENFDFVVRGRGEIPLLNIFRENYNSTGISYLENGNPRINPVCRISIPGYPRASNEFLNVNALPAARVYTALGCGRSIQCVFCADTLHVENYINRPIQDVIAEIKYLYSNFGTKYIYFGDENFFHNEPRALTLIDEINRLDLDIIVCYQVRVRSTTRRIIEKAAQSGKCTEIQFGVESLSQDILTLIKKEVRLDEVKQVCAMTKNNGINTHCYFLIGLPGETHKTAELTIRKMEELINDGYIDMVEYRTSIPFPGAPMWSMLDKYNIKITNTDWGNYRGEERPPFNLDGMTSDEIYNYYLHGLEIITDAYKKRYIRDFGDNISNFKILSSVVESGF